MEDARHDLYTVAALLAELDRVLNPLPFEEYGDLIAAPSVPPPLPPVTPRNGPRSTGGGAPGRRPPGVIVAPPTPSLSPPRPRSVVPPPADLSEAAVSRAAPAPPTHHDATAEARPIVVSPSPPAIAPVASPIAVPIIETRVPGTPPTPESPQAPPPRPLRYVAPPDLSRRGRPTEPPRIPAQRPTRATAEPPVTSPASPGPAPDSHAPPGTRPAASSTEGAGERGREGEGRASPWERGMPPHGRDRPHHVSTPANLPRDGLMPPPLPRGTTNGSRGARTEHARPSRHAPGAVDHPSDVGVPFRAIDEGAGMAAPFDTAEETIDCAGSLATVDDDADDSSERSFGAASPDAARFWLRGGRLRVTGPVALLARAERRLGARLGPRRGRRL